MKFDRVTVEYNNDQLALVTNKVRDFLFVAETVLLSEEEKNRIVRSVALQLLQMNADVFSEISICRLLISKATAFLVYNEMMFDVSLHHCPCICVQYVRKGCKCSVCNHKPTWQR